jgi:hypothetical protein
VFIFKVGLLLMQLSIAGGRAVFARAGVEAPRQGDKNLGGAGLQATYPLDDRGLAGLEQAFNVCVRTQWRLIILLALAAEEGGFSRP